MYKPGQVIQYGPDNRTAQILFTNPETRTVTAQTVHQDESKLEDIPLDSITGVITDPAFTIRPKPGEWFIATMPHSEVCMHMRVAGKPMILEVTKQQYPSVQLRHLTAHYNQATTFSSPILTGEAGIYVDQLGLYFYPNRQR